MSSISDRLTDRPTDRPSARDRAPLGAQRATRGEGVLEGRPVRGIALLDVLIALTILGTAGLALTSLLRQAIIAQAELARVESTMDNADRVLAALTLLGREDLDRRLGRHRIGEFVSNIQRPEPGLYRVALAEASASERTILVTVVYRADPKQQ